MYQQSSWYIYNHMYICRCYTQRDKHVSNLHTSILVYDCMCSSVSGSNGQSCNMVGLVAMVWLKEERGRRGSTGLLQPWASPGPVEG